MTRLEKDIIFTVLCITNNVTSILAGATIAQNFNTVFSQNGNLTNHIYHEHNHSPAGMVSGHRGRLARCICRHRDSHHLASASASREHTEPTGTAVTLRAQVDSEKTENGTVRMYNYHNIYGARRCLTTPLHPPAKPL